MKLFFKYIRIILSTLRGLALCVLYRLIPAKRISLTKREEKVTVSLTSYGRRVSKTLRYSLLSMLHQTVKPDRIVVWLDEQEFSDDSIPGYLRKYIVKYGIDVRFCPNIRSYKKLIPSLKAFPSDMIVTIDDDLVYDRHLIELLYMRHCQEPRAIICSNAHEPRFDAHGILPYKRWNLNTPFSNEILIFPLGGSGTLYPPRSLHHNVFDEEVFMKLAPAADDIWFWVMGLRNGTESVVLGHSIMYMEIDLIHQFFHKQSSLKGANLGANQNDVQLQLVMSHYGMISEREFLENLLISGKN